MQSLSSSSFFFFFNDTATTEIYTLSLHDALPISPGDLPESERAAAEVLALPMFAELREDEQQYVVECVAEFTRRDRKSTRLNSSHGYISYAVFCLKKKKKLHHGEQY